jgi:short-chain fatty acids transporter
MALALTTWTERWVPDAFIFALLATLIVAVACGRHRVIGRRSGGCLGPWLRDLIPFTLQMALVIITGHVLATSRPMGAFIRAVASLPTTPRAAVALSRSSHW